MGEDREIEAAPAPLSFRTLFSRSSTVEWTWIDGRKWSASYRNNDYGPYRISVEHQVVATGKLTVESFWASRFKEEWWFGERRDPLEVIKGRRGEWRIVLKGVSIAVWKHRRCGLDLLDVVLRDAIDQRAAGAVVGILLRRCLPDTGS